MFNSILNGSLGDTEVVKINFSDGTSTSVPKDLYNKLYKLYDTAYGIAYTYNLPQPKWEHFVEGIGESVITELAYLAFAKNPSKTGSWADVVKERISKYPAPTNYLYAPQPKTQTIVEPEPQPQTIVEPEPQPQTIVEPEPQTIVEPEPQTQTIVEPEPPQIAPIPEPTNIQTPGDNGEEGTSLLIPGLILIGGVIGAIILSKKSSKRR